MWITRDKDNENFINLTVFKPKRVKSGVWVSGDEENASNRLFHRIPIDFYPSITWDDEPIEIEFTPKKQWYNCEEINSLLEDLGYLPNQTLSYIEKVIKENNIKIILFKTKEVLKNTAISSKTWMYAATHEGDDFTQDFNEYNTKNEAFKTAIIESLSYLWLNKNHIKNNNTNGK